MRQLRLLFTLLSVAVVNFAFGVNFTSEGLIYNTTSDTEMTVEVTGWDKSWYTNSDQPNNPNVGVGEDGEKGPGNMIIPWRVLYNGLAPIFEDTNLANVTLYVLSGYTDVYSTAEVWKDFGKISPYADYSVLMVFDDPKTKEVCVQNWDANFDGELSYREAMNVTDLGGAFTGNTEITSFKELRSFSGLSVIGSAAFYGCENLQSITMAPNVTSIESEAFYGCASLEAISLGTKIKSIGDHAFDGCSSLTGFTVPKICTWVGEGALANCTSLTKVAVVSGNTSYAHTAQYKSLITKDGKTMVAYCSLCHRPLPMWLHTLPLVLRSLLPLVLTMWRLSVRALSLA